MSEFPNNSDENNQRVLKVEEITEKTETRESDSHPVLVEEETSSTEDDTMATSTETGTGASNDIYVDTEIEKSDKEIVNEILELKSKISTLVSNIRDTKTLCDKYDNQNQYLQDYVGSLMKSGEIK